MGSLRSVGSEPLIVLFDLGSNAHQIFFVQSLGLTKRLQDSFRPGRITPSMLQLRNALQLLPYVYAPALDRSLSVGKILFLPPGCGLHWLAPTNLRELSRIVVTSEFGKRGLIEFMEDVTKLFLFAAAFGEIWSVVPAQRADKSVAVLTAYLAILIAMALTQRWLLVVHVPVLVCGPNANSSRRFLSSRSR